MQSLKSLSFRLGWIEQLAWGGKDMIQQLLPCNCSDKHLPSKLTRKVIVESHWSALE